MDRWLIPGCSLGSVLTVVLGHNKKSIDFFLWEKVTTHHSKSTQIQNVTRGPTVLDRPRDLRYVKY